ncbi:MAG: mannose-6-phosphate isomerase, class I [Spirochaetia bacterium]|nr:mannose-6-phosphate isomerase, class I [Spirochaetia bacterium]
MDVVKLNGVIKPYLWGDSYFISNLLGHNRKKSSQPQGELWIGTHEAGEATLVIDETPLKEYLSTNSDEVLGSSHIQRFGKDLPFLLKVLAIKNPLSLQVHPNKEQAEKGYAREREMRALGNPSQLNYSDDRQKDEVLFALTPVTAMVGFRDIKSILEDLSAIIGEHFNLFSTLSTSEEFFKVLLNIDESIKREMLKDLEAYVSITKEVEPSLFLNSREIALRALSLYPEDIMCFAPFFLNVVHLDIGQAIHVKPTTLHAYVYGHGVELMSSSDNVLRGGLTNKKVDVKELLSTLSFSEERIEKVTKRNVSDYMYTLNVESKEFVFSYVEKGMSEGENHDTLEIALVIEGNGKMKWNQKEIRYSKGDILLIPSTIDFYTIQNSGLVILASVPKENK